MSENPTKRQIQLTLMSAGIKQFIEQLESIDDSFLEQLTAIEFREFIVDIGNESIDKMKPLDYTLERNE